MLARQPRRVASRWSEGIGGLCVRQRFDAKNPENGLRRMGNAPYIPLEFNRLTEEEMRETADRMFERFSSRRTVRHFSTEPLPSRPSSASTGPSSRAESLAEFADSVDIPFPAMSRRELRRVNGLANHLAHRIHDKHQCCGCQLVEQHA